MCQDVFPDCGSKKPGEKAHKKQYQEVVPGHFFNDLQDIDWAQFKKYIKEQKETDKGKYTNNFILLYHLEIRPFDT